MPLPPEFFLGLLTPSVQPHSGNVGNSISRAAAGIRQNRQIDMQAEQQKQAAELDKVQMAFDKQKQALNVAKHQQNQREAFADALGEVQDALISGDPKRVAQAQARLRALGGQINPQQAPGAGGAPEEGPGGDSGDDLGGAPLPGGMDEFSPQDEAVSPEGWGDEEPAPGGAQEPQAVRPPGPGAQSPGEVASGYDILDPLGQPVMRGYSPESALDENKTVVRQAAFELASPYMDEFPIEAGMVADIADEAAEAVLGSPGGTVGKAVDYMTKLLNDRLRSRFGIQTAQAYSGAADDVSSSLEYTRGSRNAAQFAQSTGILSRAQGSREAAESLNRLQDMITAQETEGTPINMSIFTNLIYQLVKMNEGEAARPTEADFQRAFSGATTIEDVRNALSGKLGLDPNDYLGSLMSGEFIDRDGTVTTQTAKRLYRTILSNYRAFQELTVGDKERLRSTHKAMVDAGIYGSANGFAGYVNSLYGQDLLPIVRPEDFVPGALRPGDPGGALGIRAGAGTSASGLDGPPIDDSPGSMQKVVQMTLETLGRLTGGPPEGALERALTQLRELRAKGGDRTRAAHLERAIEQHSAALRYAGQSMQATVPPPGAMTAPEAAEATGNDEDFLRDLGYEPGQEGGDDAGP